MPTFEVITLARQPQEAGASCIGISRMLHCALLRIKGGMPINGRFAPETDNELWKCAYPAVGVRYFLELENDPREGTRIPCRFRLFQTIGKDKGQMTLARGAIDCTKIDQGLDGLKLCEVDLGTDPYYSFVLNPEPV